MSIVMRDELFRNNPAYLHVFPYNLHNRQQQIFLVTDLNVSPKWEINIDVGVGPTASTDPSSSKASWAATSIGENNLQPIEILLSFGRLRRTDLNRTAGSEDRQ